MVLELEQYGAKICHINTRKEGKEGEETLACDIKLEIDAAACEILPYFASDLRYFMFNDEGDTRYPQMGSVKWSGEMLNMEVDISDVVFMGARLSKFELKPFIDNRAQDDDRQRVLLTMSATIKPSGRDLAIIAEYLNEEALLTVRPRQKELEL